MPLFPVGHAPDWYLKGLRRGGSARCATAVSEVSLLAVVAATCELASKRPNMTKVTFLGATMDTDFINSTIPFKIRQRGFQGQLAIPPPFR